MAGPTKKARRRTGRSAWWAWPMSTLRSTTRSSRSPTLTARRRVGERRQGRFKGSRKSTPFAAQMAAENAAKEAHGSAVLRKVESG